MKKNGFTLVELLAVIAILSILVIVAMPNVLGMFNEAKVNTFVTDVQKIMDTAVTEFTNDSFSQSGKTIYYSSVENANLETSKLNIDASGKDYFIEMDRNGQFKRVVVYDDNYCYDVYSYYGNSSGNELDKTKTKILNNKFGKVYVNKEDVYQSGDDGLIVSVNGSSFRVKGCDALKYYDGTDNAVVPEGGKYTAVDGTVYNPGDRMPEYPSTGDIYSFGNYQYTYNKNRVNYNTWVTDESMIGWAVSIGESISGDTAPEILTYVNNKPIVSLDWLYAMGEGAMIKNFPKIPDTVKSLNYAFSDCVFGSEIPEIPYGTKKINYAFVSFGRVGNDISFPSDYVIPETVVEMSGTFKNSRIKNAPEIPKNVLKVDELFFGCYKLVTAPKIPDMVESMKNVFNGCSSLSFAPSLDNLKVAEDFENTFKGCSSLIDASNIILPKQATNLQSTFANCSSMVNPPNFNYVRGTNNRVVLGYTFDGCTNLTGKLTFDFYFNGIGQDVFRGTSKSILLEGNSSTVNYFVNRFANVRKG